MWHQYYHTKEWDFEIGVNQVLQLKIITIGVQLQCLREPIFSLGTAMSNCSLLFAMLGN